MKRLFLAVIFCILTISIAYGQDLKSISSGAKERAAGIAKEQATAIIDDSTITAEVKVKLTSSPSIKDAKIEVSTTEGVVTLTGSVKSKQMKDSAAKIAKTVKGVKSVDNQLVIEKPASKAKKPAAKK